MNRSKRGQASGTSSTSLTGLRIMTINQFTAPRAKLRAAQRHGAAFREELARYIAENKDCIKIVTKPPSTDQVVVATLAPVSHDLSVMAGEIAQQIRSALDILACDLARWSGVPNVNGVYFPIAKTKDGYFDKRSRDKIKKLKPELQDMIDAIKPYGDSILVALNTLASTDKHQALLDVSPSIKDSDWTAYGQGDFEKVELSFRSPALGEHHEVELLRLPASTPIQLLNLKLKCNVVFRIEPVVGKPVLEILTEMGRSVQDIIRRFEARCFGP
jgi:hypothetical protein